MPVSVILSELIELKRSGDAGLVVQLTQQLRRLIAGGRIKKGAVLPSSRALAADLAVSRNTVTYAFEQLAAEGYLTLAQGRRPVVAADIAERMAGAKPKLTRSARSNPGLGLSPWAARLSDMDWPQSYQAAFRPLRPGVVDSREFPHEIWARCLRLSAARRTREAYGPVNRAGLRRALKDYLEASRGVHAEENQIFILPTAQAALTLIAATVIAPGDCIWTEDPGYPGAAAAFQAAGAEVVGVRIDAQGMRRANVARVPKIIFATASHQHPTGRLMPVARRMELLAAVQPGRTWIVEDDYDGEFHYDSRPVPALQGLDSLGRVFYVGTFAKVMTPDIRFGYIVAPAALVRTMEVAQRHMGLIAAVQVQDALAEFISDGHFLAHLRRMRRVYHARRDHLVGQLERHLGRVLSVEVPPGGIQLVVRLTRGAADKTMAQRLIGAGVEVRALSSLAIERPADQGLLLGFAAWRESEISAAVRTMAACLTPSARVS